MKKTFGLFIVSMMAMMSPALAADPALDAIMAKVKKAKGPARIGQLYNLSKAAQKHRLYQVAAFPLMQIIQESKNTEDRRKALMALFPIASRLEEKSLLEFAAKKVYVEQLDKQSRKLILLDLAAQSEKTAPEKSLAWAQTVIEEDPGNAEANYYVGTLMLKMNKPGEAIPYFEKAVQILSGKKSLARKRSMALLGIARAYYQGKRWDEAAEAYRKIPKPDPFYRESLTELSWALFRAGKFRSAVSPLQSLETPYYENYFNPEPLLLHGIINLFSCNYDEGMQKVDGFQAFYVPAFNQIQSWSKSDHKVEDLLVEIDYTRQALKTFNKTGDLKTKSTLPFFVMRTILAESDVASDLRYQDRLKQETEVLERVTGKRGTFYAFASKVIQGRHKSSRVRTAYKVQRNLERKAEEIHNFSVQFDFLRYELLNGQRTVLKAKNSKEIIEEKEAKDRDFFVQNGYRLWPLEGEYWRDEIGSFQHVGENACVK